MKLVDSSACLGDRSFFPPGFRFHPTDEELILYYLKRKICGRRLKLDIIGETDVYKWDPEDLPGQSKLKTGDRQWFFFSPRDRKYPNGGRSNRATRYGYWKATGKDRVIKYYTRHVGTKKTLVFYQGRAPAGVRTDWVMHEYTLDEEELRRCHSVQDYYALYKVYKKSGPGPKNGEQYGALFQEEDWPDDDCVTVNGHALSDNPTGQVDDVTSIYNSRCNTQLQSPLHDLEEFVNQVRDETLLATDYTPVLQQLISEEETQTTMVDSSSRKTNLPVQSAVLHSSSQQFDVQAKFDVTQSATSELQLYEASEVISASITNRQEPHVAEDDLLEDFLEINDLVGPQPTVPSIQNPGSNLQSEEIDGLSEFDLFHDAAMFLHDSGLASALISQSCLNCLESGSVNPVSSSYLNYPENEIANQVPESYLNNLEKDMVNPLNCQLQPHPNDYLEKDMVTPLNCQLQPLHINNENQINDQLWVHDQISNIYRPAESNHGSLPPLNSGVLYAGNSENLPPEDHPTLNLVEDDGTESWFSSALWSFVESIPTTPASASENALVNRAFLRMSSFGRASINAVNKNVTAGNLSTTVRKSGKCNRGIFCFSVLGVVCAILWVIMGTSVKVLGRYIPS